MSCKGDQEVKVLQVISALGCGGVEKLLLEYCSRITDCCDIDILTFSQSKDMLEDDFLNIGCQVFKATRISTNIFKTYKDLNRVMKNGDYDIIHCHQGYLSFLTLIVAVKNKIPVRIAHSHIAFDYSSFLKTLRRKILGFITKRVATNLFACGIDAGAWAWGKKAVDNGRVYIMKNAVNLKDYAFNEEVREIKRKELGIENKFVIGNVARLSYQKNQEFLIEIFKEVCKKTDNAVLLIAGNGEDYDFVKNKVENSGQADKIYLLGARNDVKDLLNAMDVFALPSRYEGLPVTLVEAQANGLNCVVSDTVTKEVNVCNAITYVGIEGTEKVWADKLIATHRLNGDFVAKGIKESGYDIDTESIKLIELYSKLRR